MKYFLAAVLAVCLLAVSVIVFGAKPYSQVAYRLEFKDGFCSATAVARNVILTAKHCFPTNEAISFKIGDRQARVIKLVEDGRDHVLVYVNIQFENIAVISKRVPKVGEQITYIGNPSGLVQLYRIGYISGYIDGSMILDVNGWQGDSGAGVMNERGHVIGVISFVFISDHFKVMSSLPLAFTSEQYQDAGIEV